MSDCFKSWSTEKYNAFFQNEYTSRQAKARSRVRGERKRGGGGGGVSIWCNVDEKVALSVFAEFNVERRNLSR